MIEIVAIKTVGVDHLEYISDLKWVETDNPGSPSNTAPKVTTRAAMYTFVKDNPKVAFAMSKSRKTFAYLEAVNGVRVQYVKTIPDITTADNLLSLPRFQ